MDLKKEVKQLKSTIAELQASIAELRKALPCLEPNAENCCIDQGKMPCDQLQSRPPPTTVIPNTYVLLVDSMPTEDNRTVVGVIHILPAHRGRKNTTVVDTRITKANQYDAALRMIGGSLRVIITHCPEKLVIYLKDQQTVDMLDSIEDLAKDVKADLQAVQEQFPVEIKAGIPKGFDEEIKSLMLQAEFEYIRQKEKANVTEHRGSSANRGGTNP